MRAYDGDRPAFPFEEKERRGVPYQLHPGMTLRDYFAAQALPGLLTICRDDRIVGMSYPDHCAMGAYECADAMLKARQS